VKDRLIRNLSKGYKQRVGIAQALIGDPKVIIFDEPTVGLDPKQILEVRNLIRTLGRKHTVILSTHILAEVQAVCERIIIINKGHIIADERTENMVKTIEDGYFYEAKICGPSKDVLAAIKRLPGVKAVDATGQREGDAFVFNIESSTGVDVRKPLFRLCAEKNWPIVGLMPIGTDLESVFIRLVDRSEKKALVDLPKSV
jgi:ABC-2 type transport system ATP-binding protein